MRRASAEEAAPNQVRDSGSSAATLAAASYQAGDGEGRRDGGSAGGRCWSAAAPGSGCCSPGGCGRAPTRRTCAPREGETVFNAFLKIGRDGRVIVAVPQAELGQGVWTSLPQILADELGADWRTVSVEPAPLCPLYANILLAEEAADDSGWPSAHSRQPRSRAPSSPMIREKSASHCCRASAWGGRNTIPTPYSPALGKKQPASPAARLRNSCGT